MAINMINPPVSFLSSGGARIQRPLRKIWWMLIFPINKLLRDAAAIKRIFVTEFSLVQIVTLTGYTDRFMFLGVSHEGKTNANGAGDETFRFWNLFQSMKAQNKALRLVENINPG
ncbi:hypothetical protein F2Q68_00017586 [Brassica cretica]|uniref:Uncharacterized protein n=1 Tax=Brassica cretica TaxID=69181 RepID=A0A8S9HKH3_BRACR|nr:hypothetical protein F2Q68_00017586 [Brassica cretica]